MPKERVYSSFRDHRDVEISRESLLDIRALEARGLTAPFDLALRAGVIVGLYGLKGSGRTQLLRALFGLERRSAGEIRIGGQTRRIRSPRDAIRAGLAWVCRDRKEFGLFANLDVGENLSITALDALARAGFIDQAAERRAVENSIQRLGIRPRAPGRPSRRSAAATNRRCCSRAGCCAARAC